jgi:hypothetical protein
LLDTVVFINRARIPAAQGDALHCNACPLKGRYLSPNERVAAGGIDIDKVRDPQRHGRFVHPSIFGGAYDL